MTTEIPWDRLLRWAATVDPRTAHDWLDGFGARLSRTSPPAAKTFAALRQSRPLGQLLSPQQVVQHVEDLADDHRRGRPLTPATEAAPGDGPWGPVHRWAAAADTSSGDALQRGLREVAGRLPGSRGQQLLARAAKQPPPAGDRYALCRWALDFQNAVRAAVGRTAEQRDPVPYEQAAVRFGWPAEADGFIHVHQSAHGIGDAIVGLYAACGLADVSDRPVVYHARFTEWFGRVSHPNLTIAGHIDRGPDLNAGHAGYLRQLREAPSRAAAYCGNAAAKLGLPAFAAVRPRQVDASASGDGVPGWGPYVVLCPFSHHPGRQWPAPLWAELARRLLAAGLVPVAIDYRDAVRERAIVQTFGAVPGCHWILGRDADGVAELMLGAAAVVGNDSGMVHVAGLLGVPAVCVHAGILGHDFLFAGAPSITSVTSGRTYARSEFDNHGGDLQAIPVERVLAEVLRRVGAVVPAPVATPSLSGALFN